jgi:hypothetical protein
LAVADPSALQVPPVAPAEGGHALQTMMANPEEFRKLVGSIVQDAVQGAVERVVSTLQIPPQKQQPLPLSQATQDQKAAETVPQPRADEFDVFLAHNAQDKDAVRVVAGKLRERGLCPWLDVDAIPPGRSFQDEIQKALGQVKSMIVFVGPAGIARWVKMELRSIISQCVDTNRPVIPVLLPGVTEFPPDLLFLREFHCVRFHSQTDEREALDALVWGITGKRPGC